MKQLLLLLSSFVLVLNYTHAQISSKAEELFQLALSCKDKDQSLSYMRQSAEMGLAKAQNKIGYLYLIGFPQQDYNCALHWIQKAAQQNDVLAICNLGHMYLHSLGVKQDCDKALSYYNKAVEQGSFVGLYSLGVFYKEGYCGTKDYNKALSFFMKAMERAEAPVIVDEKEFADSIYGLSALYTGTLYNDGLAPIPQDWDKAYQYYSLAEKKGIAMAQTNIGYIYFNGSGTFARDFTKAYTYFSKAAEKHEAIAQRFLGFLFMNALGVPQDYDKAYYWTSLAVEQGDATAMNNLGTLYLNGLGVEKDNQRALYWYHQAAAKGEKQALSNIGYMYENGYGVTLNLDSAYAWYQKAYDNGFEDIKPKVELLEAKLASSKGISTSVVSDKTIALVIGNADYRGGALRNSLNDARDLSSILQAQGIKVIPCYNGGTHDINTKVHEFCEAAKHYDAALFYYSGHGLQKDGTNYLVPVNVDLTSGSVAEDQLVSVSSILAKIARSGVRKKIVFLDACRTTPADNLQNGFTSGMADMAQWTGIPAGTYVFYAASTGQIAEDGQGRNSPFTQALTKMLSKSNIEVRQLFLDVRDEVMALTNRRQTPSANDNMMDRYFFNIKAK